MRHFGFLVWNCRNHHQIGTPALEIGKKIDPIKKKKKKKKKKIGKG
jgi:hypothetical protein